MEKTLDYIIRIFQEKGIMVDAKRMPLLTAMASEADTQAAVEVCTKNEDMLTRKWRLKNRIADIQQQSVSIPNATAGQAYEASLDLQKFGWTDIVHIDVESMESIGLSFDRESLTISGTPRAGGDYAMKVLFRISGEPEESKLNEKIITLIINPDPKTLWKDLPSDQADKYWKPDEQFAYSPLGDRHLVVGSKRGRAHANVGSFRDDHYEYAFLPDTGWAMVAVADGAGSAKLSRYGSKIACEAVAECFKMTFSPEISLAFDQLIPRYRQEASEEVKQRLHQFALTIISNIAKYAHNALADAAAGEGAQLKDLHTTLVFSIFKKYDFGYAVVSFSVGDCPIAIISKGHNDVHLLNTLDVGSFSGGTRFITMPEIFKADAYRSRIRFTIVDDFAYLMLMSDGIYDAKFAVEADLEKPEKWQELIIDLDGDNPDGIAVEFKPDNTEICKQLSAWMDFWSKGNHDDRTLAVVY